MWCWWVLKARNEVQVCAGGMKRGAGGAGASKRGPVCWVLEMGCWWVLGTRNAVLVVPVARQSRREEVLVGAGGSKRGFGED